MATVLIVKRGNEFLVGRIFASPDLRWSCSKWDAWGCRNPKAAKAVAAITGGDLWLFNMITGEIREARV